MGEPLSCAVCGEPLAANEMVCRRCDQDEEHGAAHHGAGEQQDELRATIKRARLGSGLAQE